MDANLIISLVSSLGFPIVVCGALMWYIVKITSEHKAETVAFTEALNKNTLVLTKICDRLNVDEV